MLRSTHAIILAVAFAAAPSGGASATMRQQQFAQVAPPAMAEPVPKPRPAERPARKTEKKPAAKMTKQQAEALETYDKALAKFKAILKTRRAQLDAKLPLPRLSGQDVYLARINVISTYKELTDVMPQRIGRPNQFGIPPAYFDADIEPLIVEYGKQFDMMQAPPRGAQASETPFEDVADIGRAIARAKGLDAATAEVAARISLGIFFAETNGKQNIGNARSDSYKGSLQTSPAEDRKGQAKWAALRPRVVKLYPAVAARDAREEARVGDGDQRYNHWTAVRNGLTNAHAEIFAQLPEIARMLPDPADQMKLFQLIQLVPSPTRSAIASGDIEKHRVSDPRIMGYLRNNSIFTFGKVDRARRTATYREILDAMWLFTPKFEKAAAKYAEIMAQRKRAER